MIIGIGIDAVEIERFKHFAAYSHQKLSRIFSSEEITYCLKDPVKSAERFAARFAAKEALYKAFCQALPQQNMPFLALCKHTSISLQPAPVFKINWKELNRQPCSVLVAITHTQKTALAQVIMQAAGEKS